MNKLGKIFTSAGFEEDEVKLNAPDKDDLNRLWNFILNDPYYEPSNSSYLTNGHPDDVNWGECDPDEADVPQSTSKWRYRYYFDTPDMDLYKKGIELRLQPEKGGAYRQVIKFNAAATHDTIVLQRLEFPALIRGFEPDLQAIDKKAEFRNNAIEILHDTIRNASLGPKAAIRSQRRKTEYHPGNDKNIMIEGGLDIGVGVNIAGFRWKLRQAELESKKNETVRPTTEILTEEAHRMQRSFPNLEATVKSKPSDGFDDLLLRTGSKKAKKIIEDLPRDRFTITDQLPPPREP